MSIAIARAEYVVWYDALVLLADTLKGKLERYDVIGPAASPDPWRHPNVERPVLHSRRQAPTRALPLKYPRPAPKRRLGYRLGQAI